MGTQAKAAVSELLIPASTQVSANVNGQTINELLVETTIQRAIQSPTVAVAD